MAERGKSACAPAKRWDAIIPRPRMENPFFEVITSKYLASRPANPSSNGQPRELSGWGRAGESKRGGRRGGSGATGMEEENERRKSDNANMLAGQYPGRKSNRS